MESDTKNRLLSEFPPHTEAEWKEAAIQLLKGRPFEKTLITPTYEGFDLQPLYTREGMRKLPHLADQPGMGTQVRGSRIEGYLETGWLVSQELSAPTPAALNAIALKELEGGQSELNFWLDRPGRCGEDAGEASASVGVCGVSLSTVEDLSVLLEGIHPEMISLYFQSGASAPALYALLSAWMQKQDIPGKDIRGCIGFDPVGWLAETGSLPGSTEKVFDVMAELVQAARSDAPQLQVIDVQGHPYHNAGASSVQEMAAVLATGSLVLKELAKRGLEPEAVVPRMRLSVSIGGNTFIEIAKLRALRILWNRIMEAFGVDESARKLHLHARTGLWNKTLFDPYVNMLRTTTEAFSAVVGGCDSLHVSPFDEIIRESGPFSRRIARNTHAVLAEECGMKQVLDPSGGSWAVETLTDDMAREAWKKFQEIEAGGGILDSLGSGLLQEAVAAVRADKLKNIQRRKDVIVGTNTYPNAGEKPLPAGELDYEAARRERIEYLNTWKAGRDAASVKAALEAVASASGTGRMEALVKAASAGATLGELQEALALGEPDITASPLKLHRAAEEFEQLRLAARALAQSGKPPLLHQLNMGPSRRYRMRADWTTSFFQAGGLEVLSADDYDDADAAVGALKESGARVALITSDDETYGSVVAPLASAIKALDPGIKVLVAGAPGENEAAWRESGVDDFVHIRVNTYAFNRALLEELGATL
jgi:methylmalonyl-CoA mutase